MFELLYRSWRHLEERFFDFKKMILFAFQLGDRLLKLLKLIVAKI